MNTTTHSASPVRKVTVGIVAAVGMLLLLPAVALGSPRPVAAPAIPGVAALPGPVIDAGKPAATMTTLKVTPDIALPGTATTISGAGLPAGKDV